MAWPSSATSPERLLGAHWCNVYSQYERPSDPTPEEREYFQRVDGWTFAEGAYALEQGTKPTTLAVGLNDSPAGLAAYFRADRVLSLGLTGRQYGTLHGRWRSEMRREHPDWFEEI